MQIQAKESWGSYTNIRQNRLQVKNSYKRQRSIPYIDKRVNSSRRYNNPNISTKQQVSKMYEAKTTELKGEIDSFTLTVGDVLNN